VAAAPGASKAVAAKVIDTDTTVRTAHDVGSATLHLSRQVGTVRQISAGYRRGLDGAALTAGSTGDPTPLDVTVSPALVSQLVHELSCPERAQLLAALAPPTPEVSRPNPRTPTARRWVVRFLAVCCLGLIPWTIGLAVTLPRSYLVGNWPLAWTGFDVILLGCLGTTAWALWRQRQVAVPAAMITSVLLLCDAWFDILTAHGGRCLMVSIATAVFAEVPIAVLLGSISIRLLHASGSAVRGTDPVGSPRSLWRAALVTPGDTPSAPGGPSNGEPPVERSTRGGDQRSFGRPSGTRRPSATAMTVRPST
jgi:hypothetical protein